MTIKGAFQQELDPVPFPHFFVRQAFDQAASDTLLRWFETDAPWKLKIADFYEQYEFSFLDAELPPSVHGILNANTVDALRKEVALAFDQPLSNQVDVTAHKLLRGQRIRIHNDYIPGQESHRVLIQFNRGWSLENGGVLMFFRSDSVEDLHGAFLPVHNSSVAFEISPRSFHAVTPIEKGERFTLVFSFYAKT